MARHRGPVLLDTNAIIESWRVSGWRALAGGYALETVEFCVIETQTGLQRRRPEQQIGIEDLRASLKAVHPVSNAARAQAMLKDEQIAALDLGEQMLWAHALTRKDGWVLCGPDKASLRVGMRLGLQERLVAFDRLLEDVGFQPRIALREAYTSRWLRQALADLAALERRTL